MHLILLESEDVISYLSRPHVPVSLNENNEAIHSCDLRTYLQFQANQGVLFMLAFIAKA